MTTIVFQSIRFIVLVLLQIFVFSELHFFNFGMIFIYIYFVLFLPLTLKPWQVLLLSFATGFIIDSTTGTYGLHMAAATFIGFFKNNILRLIVGADFDDDIEFFKISQLKRMQAFLYLFVSSILFCSVFFMLDYFSFDAIQKILLQISISSVITFVSLFIYKLLFTRKA